MENLIEIWEEVVSVLKESIQMPITFNTWIKPIVPVDITDTEITLKVPTDFNRTMVGERYTGSVVRLMQFGAFVEISSTCDGMIHISKLSTKRVERVEDVVKIGDKVEVEVIKVDEKGRVDLKLVKKL